jgi:hypothetical protein
MATTVGNDGVVYIDTNLVAEVTAFDYTETAVTADDTAMGDTENTTQYVRKSGSGSVNCFWDETDTTGQGAMTVGASVTLNLYPEGNVALDTYYTGTVLITEKSVSSEKDGIVEASFSFVNVLTESVAS